MISNPEFMECVWKDAWADAVEGTSIKDAADKHKPTVMATRGWLVYEDEEGISLFNERCLDTGEEYYRGRSYILKVNIQSLTALKVLKPRKRKNEVITPIA